MNEERRIWTQSILVKHTTPHNNSLFCQQHLLWFHHRIEICKSAIFNQRLKVDDHDFVFFLPLRPPRDSLHHVRDTLHTSFFDEMGYNFLTVPKVRPGLFTLLFLHENRFDLTPKRFATIRPHVYDDPLTNGTYPYRTRKRYGCRNIAIHCDVKKKQNICTGHDEKSPCNDELRSCNNCANWVFSCSSHC